MRWRSVQSSLRNKEPTEGHSGQLQLRFADSWSGSRKRPSALTLLRFRFHCKLRSPCCRCSRITNIKSRAISAFVRPSAVMANLFIGQLNKVTFTMIKRLRVPAMSLTMSIQRSMEVMVVALVAPDSVPADAVVDDDQCCNKDWRLQSHKLSSVAAPVVGATERILRRSHCCLGDWGCGMK